MDIENPTSLLNRLMAVPLPPLLGNLYPTEF
jgi:hypothetical protein